MPESEYTPAPKEIREAEESLEPWQAAMTRAKWDVMSHAQDFTAAGVSQEQIEKAAELAGERAKLEFEQKQKEDPYRRVAQIIEDAAETLEEKKWAEAMIHILEQHRTSLINAARTTNSMEKTGKELALALMWNDQSRLEVDQRPHTNEYQSVVRIMPHSVTSQYYEPPPEKFFERVVRGLRALEPNKPLESLKSLPKTPAKLGQARYYESFNVAIDLPTSIEGVRLDVCLGIQKEILVKMDMERVRQIIHFPESA
ncbi:MAG: hypothetical protein HY396_01420 [Candidatus Doudnabacteria bacterium]|nr:hypothetical protein [Candidatus Doudnabacteria bacterium]